MKTDEFINLVQGDMKVKEYINKFDGLAKFTIDLMQTDVARKEQFIQGLNFGIA